MHNYSKTFQNKIPSEWKEVNLTPIYKKNAKTKTVYYRGISLCSIICKIVETLVKKSL